MWRNNSNRVDRYGYGESETSVVHKSDEYLLVRDEDRKGYDYTPDSD